MITVYATQDQLLINHLKNLLDQKEVVSVLEQVHLQGAMGELPLTAWPSIRVPDREQAEKAKAIIDEAMKPDKAFHSIWKCKSCGEQIEAQFTACWNCGKEMSKT